MRRAGRWLLVVLALALLLLGALPALRAWSWWRESNPIRRGQVVAARIGCFTCHGPRGTHGLLDPGSQQEIPIWTGGVPMMYVDGPDEIREYILDGLSRRRKASVSARAEWDKAAIRMPPFRGVLSRHEVDDLTAYVMAASHLRPVDDERAARGLALVLQYRCESCHGPTGAGGVRNPGSFKGYIPGWLGADFAELVRDDGELRGWILDGGIERLEGDRLARYFLTRQRLQMPVYRAALSAEQADAIIFYIRWLRTRP
jgi:mono/diheme cytochrome c family protein